ncbi:ethylene-responsive transcription factor LEP-like [Forsythia ovata]|uniref:Ethylene-responsive transcription factor LEP-like n=1 Tax=Forsythia ovata TaxID=205694 RepID=A0ABD1WVL6_9LAMI
MLVYFNYCIRTAELLPLPPDITSSYSVEPPILLSELGCGVLNEMSFLELFEQQTMAEARYDMGAYLGPNLLDDVSDGFRNNFSSYGWVESTRGPSKGHLGTRPGMRSR